MKRWLVALVLGFSLVGLAQAAIDTYEFANEAERARFRELTQELRCPKCQNQDIADSNAPIAADLRKEIFRMLGEGKSNEQIVDFMVDRYGEFVRYKPAVTARTLVLWYSPAALLGIGLLVMAVLVVRRRRTVTGADTTLSSDEQARLDVLLNAEPSANNPSSVAADKPLQ